MDPSASNAASLDLIVPIMCQRHVCTHRAEPQEQAFS
jgi:hypothetical protein